MAVPVAATRALYALVTLSSVAIALGVFHEMHLRGHAAQDLSKAQALCRVPARERLPTDLTRGLLRPVDDLLCVTVPMVRAAVSSETRLGLQALAWTVLVPVFYRLSHLAISPSFGGAAAAGPVFAGGALPLLAIFLTPVLGPGVVVAGIVVPLYALGMLLQLRKDAPAKTTPVPVPASAIYSVNICVLSLTFLLFLLFSLEPSAVSASGRSNWQAAALLFTIWPFYTGFVVSSASFARRAPADEREAVAMLLREDPDTISYGFERIWGYYRRVALIAIGLWYFGLIRIYMLLSELHSHESLFASLRRGEFYAIVRSGKAKLTGETVFGPAEYRMALNAAALAFSAVALLIIERLTIRSTPAPPSPPTAAQRRAAAAKAKAAGKPADAAPAADAPVPLHPITGEPRSQLDTDCQRAIAGAPAGLPAAEVGWGIVLSALIGGPGFALLLWWSRGEEETGWKARRAYRAAAAAAAAK